jgi:hypothetical protein
MEMGMEVVPIKEVKTRPLGDFNNPYKIVLPCGNLLVS